ncbi:hypothetical protein QBC45DRAFT_469418 [Copromyces sp. CBS 386.78]|nr:hypothetical protein QBC45DRAFT_469418 [Copromyces sp. CBS 386.78]
MNDDCPPPNGHGSNGQRDHHSSNGYDSNGQRDHRSSNGHLSHGHEDQSPLNGHASSAQPDDLSDFDILKHFQVELNQYNALHANLNHGLSLLVNVNRDQRNRIQQQDERIELLSSTVNQFKRLMDDSERRARELEAENRDLRAKNRVLNNNSNAFACLIIDGDGALFRDEYLNQGEEGGREAAHMLHSELKAYMELANPRDHIKNIVAKVYLNVEGLTKALMESGIIHEEDKLTKFGRGFCQAQPFFEFIDVGRGKEKADLKATKHFELMVDLKQCKRVMLAGCHDNGYATYLEEYRWANSKITLLETTPAANGVAKLNKHFDFRKFPDIFRSEPLLSTKKRSHQSHPITTPFGMIAAPPSPPPTYATKAQEPAIAKRNQPEVPSDAQRPNGACPSAAQLKGAPPSSALVKRPSQTQAVEIPALNSDDRQKKNQQATDEDGFQTVGARKVIKVGRQASSNDPIIGNSRNPHSNTGLHFYLNNAGQRIDYPACRNHESQGRKSIEDRSRKNGANLCNGYHLIGRCKHTAESNYGHCDYVHELDTPLTYEEKKFLWYKARSVVCKNGSACRDDYCLAGHHCAWGKDCRYKSDCRFKHTHGMDLERVYIVEEGDPIPKGYKNG